MGGLVDAVFGKSPPPPDYTPVANASREVQELANEVAREQLAENKRQFDANQAVAQQVVGGQLDLMEQTRQQGQDYYDYGKSFRPVEQSMAQQAMQGNQAISQAERQAIQQTGQAQADQLLTSATDYQNQQALRAAQAEDAQRAQADQIRTQTGAYLEGAKTDAERLREVGLANAQALRDRTSAFEGDVSGDIALATGADRGISDRFGQDIQREVGQAVADARSGQTQALNTAARQALRYGLSVPANMDAVNTSNAAALARAANQQRNLSIGKYRNLINQGIGLKQNVFAQGQQATGQAMDRQQGTLATDIGLGQERYGTALNADLTGSQMETAARQTGIDRAAQNFATGTAARTDAFNRQLDSLNTGRSQRIQDDSLDWAKRLDVTGLARGLPGASQGAYGLSINAGNAATRNQMGAGAQYLAGMQNAGNTQIRGSQIALGGLQGILGNQNSAYLTGRGQNMDVIGTAIGAAAGFSDPDIKTGIKKVGKDKKTGLNKYQFKYKGGKTKFEGVMADEVEKKYPDAVIKTKEGNRAVDYAKLGLRMKEVA